MLNKTDCLFERDDKGELIGKEVELTTLEDKPKVIVRPLPRGKLMSIYGRAKEATQDEQVKIDNEVILGGLVEPKFTEEELVNMKPKYASAIAMAIMSASLGITQKEIGDKAAAVNQEELAIKK